jgi:hypothetical protein
MTLAASRRIGFPPRMLISRRALLAGAVSLGVSARVLAEDAPLTCSRASASRRRKTGLPTRRRSRMRKSSRRPTISALRQVNPSPAARARRCSSRPGRAGREPLNDMARGSADRAAKGKATGSPGASPLFALAPVARILWLSQTLRSTSAIPRICTGVKVSSATSQPSRTAVTGLRRTRGETACGPSRTSK